MAHLARFTVERPGDGPGALVFVHARDAGGGLGRSTFTLNRSDARELAALLLDAAGDDSPGSLPSAGLR